jgi:hypothetical protein
LRVTVPLRAVTRTSHDQRGAIGPLPEARMVRAGRARCRCIGCRHELPSICNHSHRIGCHSSGSVWRDPRSEGIVDAKYATQGIGPRTFVRALSSRQRNNAETRRLNQLRYEEDGTGTCHARTASSHSRAGRWLRQMQLMLPIATPHFLQDSSMLGILERSNALLVRQPHAPAATAGEPCRIIRLERYC